MDQGYTEILGENHILVPLWTPLTSRGMAWDSARVSGSGVSD